MTRVLLIANHPTYVFTLRREIIEKLVEEYYDVAICCPYGEELDYFENMGCKIFDSSLDRHGKNIFEELKLKREYGRVIDDYEPNVILTFTIKPNLYAGMEAAKRGIPYIINITGLGTPLEREGITKKLLIKVYKYAIRKVSTIMFQNKENMHFFENNNLLKGKKVLLPGSGVNTEYFDYLDYPTSNIQRFVFISRVMKEKGIEEFLSAATTIHEEFPNTEFHICGFVEDEYKEQIEVLSKDGYIKYHGMVRDIRTVLKDMNCTIHPSYYPEGMSNVLLESASSGRPIITTDRSGCKEIVEEGNNGYIVKQQNSEDLIEKIKIFLRLGYEEKKAIGLFGRKKVVEEFDRNIVVEKYFKEITSCLNRQ
ncbi:glycosyltransferase family 4 protein [Tetragenococcus koreensis]|uniref:glycosyltransferase family 4 protein n=1 Tax=Tetragenococcus koreensis TaxID=290335 RepID=UPI001F15C461|nr:glycosyltransferase family 4 protein [Tetragenococcus koreensis]MCF1617091.1 glycosyltransferase family 4 protein [Tetragenococcus koreensis]MCF1621978.1 glycosyltransferase family 4 protein [Tetragenococcus koreensis]MCF1641821.1 glycosyltransferase family 4 protein [Tetragenococcus koreensis]MCF1678048.1 glycosyltransferase family 4 protein [Tetragenococcus koreensis]MCF1682751.1 glycosyltransferase family 4 protein [Tetragenococcus koreensis]